MDVDGNFLVKMVPENVHGVYGTRTLQVIQTSLCGV